jgi:hypothetical protein
MNVLHRLRCLPACACLAAVLATPAASRQAPASDSQKEAAARACTEAVEQIGLAHDLAAQARRNRSPLGLVAAAKILRDVEVPVGPLKVEPKVEVKEGEPMPEEKVAPPLSPREESDVLLADAGDLAARQARDGTLSRAEADAVMTLIRQVEASEQRRGATGGPRQKAGYLNPGHTHSYRIGFDGWDYALVRVFSEGRSPVEVTVISPDGQVRGADAGRSPSARWLPARKVGGEFILRVTNVGEFGTPYRLITN